MKLADGKAKRQAKAAWVLAAVLAMTGLSAALQTPVPGASEPESS